MRALMVGLLVVGLLLPFVTAPPVAESAGCEFILGFKALRDLIPNVVGECRVDEHHNPVNGDGLQESTGVDGKGGLLVWRKADNWTAYTDGFRTWINGPTGLQQRLNTERFAWEKDVVPPPMVQQAGTQWSLHQDAEKSFKYPTGWVQRTRLSGSYANNYYDSPDREAMVYYMAPFRMGSGYKPEDFLTMNMKAWAGHRAFTWGRQERTTIGGYAAVIQWYEFPGDDPTNGVSAAIQSGAQTHIIDGRASSGHWAEYEPILLEVIRSYTPK